MWVLIVVWTVASGGGAHNYGTSEAVAMQEFSSEAQCIEAAKVIKPYRNATFCVPR